jgi:exopolysaccharide biosynthesis polyprenyl glycosylphosphotransferase
LRRERPLEVAVLTQDVLVVLVSLVAAGYLREALRPFLPALKAPAPFRDDLHLLLVFLPAWALGAQRNRLHTLASLTGPPLELVRKLLFAQAWGAIALVLILVGAQVPFNRSLIALFLLLSTMALVFVKAAQRRWASRVHGQALALLLGVKRGGRTGEIEELLGRRVEVVDEWTPDALRRRLREGGADEVVVSPVVPRGDVRPLIDVCDEVGVPAFVAAERLDLGLRPPEAEVIGRTLYLVYSRHQPDPLALFVKAAVDRVASAVGLVVLSPVLLVVAALVKMTSSGPVLFVQQRGGLNGHAFPMLKFRTMRQGAEAERETLLVQNEADGPVFKMAHDPRVTPVGRFLRRTSLDELPQLINVAAGHMSIVGPRPLPVVETRELTGSHRRRLSMRPGITGLWQVSGRSSVAFEEWMALDLQYVDGWSLGLDCAILLRTLPAVLSGRGAH